MVRMNPFGRYRLANSSQAQHRFLHLYEHQSKQLMADHGINVQRFRVVASAEQVPDAVRSLNAKEMVVKAQALAGGRGKGIFSSGLVGGIQLTDKAETVQKLVSSMIGHRLVTPQTTNNGVLVQQVMIAEAKDLVRETYFTILLDRTSQCPVLLGSSKGGIDIEQVAITSPQLIHSESVLDYDLGPSEDQLTRLATKMGFTQQEGTLAQAVEQMKRLYVLFKSLDATQVEINPLGVTTDQKVLCFDAKITFDDNAEFRHQSLFQQSDALMDDPRELAAKRHNLSYIGMDGDIGCLVNGAGLAMATMDLINLHGGRPANFLDVGGSAQPKQILAALKLLMADTQVTTILVNIFGGIMRCDVIAEGLVEAIKLGILTKPVVVRLVGTNSDIGIQMIESFQKPDTQASPIDAKLIPIQVFTELEKATKTVVELSTVLKAK